MDDIQLQQKTVQVTYGKALLSVLQDNAGLAVLFINGLLGYDIPKDATVLWGNEESYVDSCGYYTEFFPQINENPCFIEVLQDDKGNLSLMVELINSPIPKGDVTIINLEEPGIVYVTGSSDKPKVLEWKWRLPDGNSETFDLATMRLVDMSVEEVAQRNLLPIGQFYLNVFEPLTEAKVPEFKAAATLLLEKLHEAVRDGKIPNYTGLQLEQGIRAIGENTIRKSRLEGELSIDPSILETLPWTDYRSLMEQERSEGISEGKTIGKAERDMEIALNAFATVGSDGNTPEKVAQTLKSWGIPDDIIFEADRAKFGGN